MDIGVIETCKEHFSWGKAWDDPRVKLHITDGAVFVRDAPDSSYDVIIQDSSDPWTTDEDDNQVLLPSSILYTKQHFVDIHRILTPTGVFNFQAETFNIPSDLIGIQGWYELAKDVGFERVRYGSLYISTYTTGQIGFMLSDTDPFILYFTAYNSAFDLPLWVEKAIYEEAVTKTKAKIESTQKSEL